MNIRNQLVHTTVRIETSGPDGEGSGTGFFMDFCTKENVSRIKRLASPSL